MKNSNIIKTINRLTNIRYIFNTILFNKINQYSNNSYSQEGEDRILFSMLGVKPKGFYVDVGAHHPQRFSNTYLFYNMGWRGINIDANPRAMELFKKIRARDINISSGVGAKVERKEFTIFDEPAINTFDSTQVNNLLDNTPYKIKEKIIVKIQPLFKILDKYMSKGVKIDFLSIDVEGLDFEVLKSNNWTKYHPTYVAIEMYGGMNFDEVLSNKVAIYLKKYNYIPVAKTLNTVIYKSIS